MKRMKCDRVFWLAVLMAASMAAPAWTAEVKLGGLIFGEYAAYLSHRTSAGGANVTSGNSSFEITRIYLTAEAKFTDKLKSKLVLEGNSTTAGNAVFIKNAFGDYAFTDYANLTFGMIGTPWIGYEEGIWGRRFVQKTQLDQEGFLQSADKGLGVLAKLPQGFGDMHFYYVNGEGYKTPEKANDDGRHKDFGGRISVAPLKSFHDMLAGFKVHGFAQQGRTQIGDARLRDRYLAGVSYQHEKFHIMYSYTAGRDGDGVLNRRFDTYSLHGSVKLPKDFSAFGRYDRVAINKAAGNDNYTRGILGVDYKLAEGARLALSDQWLQPASSAKANENQIKVNVELKF